MEKKTFLQGMVYLAEAFPSRSEANFNFYFDRLRGLEEEAFKWAIFYIVDNVEKLYPDDNLIAMIIERANHYRREKDMMKYQPITDERWDQPPQEWVELKKNLGIK